MQPPQRPAAACRTLTCPCTWRWWTRPSGARCSSSAPCRRRCSLQGDISRGFGMRVNVLRPRSCEQQGSADGGTSGTAGRFTALPVSVRRERWRAQINRPPESAQPRITVWIWVSRTHRCRASRGCHRGRTAQGQQRRSARARAGPRRRHLQRERCGGRGRRGQVVVTRQFRGRTGRCRNHRATPARGAGVYSMVDVPIHAMPDKSRWCVKEGAGACVSCTLSRNIAAAVVLGPHQHSPGPKPRETPSLTSKPASRFSAGVWRLRK